MKYTWSVILIVLMTFLFVPITTYATENIAYTSGDYEYTLNENNEATIVAYNGSATNLNIPETIDNYTVTAIGEGAFKFNTTLVDVVLADSIEIIGMNAFYECDNLVNITLSSNLVSIGDMAFDMCDSIVEIIVPDSVTYIGCHAFSRCENLQNVKLPKNLEEISAGLLCHSPITSIEIPKGVTYIGAAAFEGTALAEVTLPDGIEEIQMQAFYDCDSLTSISIPNSVTWIQEWAFANCDKLTNVQLGSGITYLMYPFEGCAALEKIELPCSMKAIYSDAFAKCYKLREVMIPPATERIDSSAFAYPSRLTVYGVSGSYAEEWAKSVNAKFVHYEKLAESISINRNAIAMQRGDSEVLAASVTPAACTDVIEWSCSDESIANIDNYGRITAVGIGSATITAKVGKFTATCELAVMKEDTPIYVELQGPFDESTSFEIYDAKGNKVTSTSVWGSRVDYPLTDLSEGTYEMLVTKKNYVSRSYTITVGAEAIKLDVELHKTGDITGDNTINARDKKMLYNHIAGTAILEDYDFAVGDVTGDGTLNARDKKMIYNHIAGTSSLWE